jgi:hypothetical protein
VDGYIDKSNQMLLISSRFDYHALTFLPKEDPMILSDAGADAYFVGGFTTACSSGYIRLYNGTVPTTANAALSGNTLLAGDLRFAATAFGAPGAGTNARRITSGAITSDPAADAGGTPTFARIFKSDGTTVLAQCTVSVSGGAGEIQIDVVPIVQNAPINGTSIYIEMPTT